MLGANEKPVARDAIQKLDKLLHQLDGFMPLLDQSAKFAANEIMTNFASVISKLHNQRKTLLQQLEQVVRNKGSYIKSQKHSIEALRISVLNCISAGHEIDHHLQDYIAKAEAVAFSTQSAPFVSFRNNNALLDQAIGAYGRIVSRYYGHFADPSLQSACLPLEVEEADDHDPEGIDGQAVGLCTCADPTIRKWLLNPHLLNSDSLCRGLCHAGKNKRDLDTAELIPSRPVYDLHTWLDQTKRPVKCFRRKLSNSFTTVDSDYSDSCPLPLNPSSVGGKFRDWLFADRMDTDMSGFSKVDPSIIPPVEVQPQTSNGIEDLYQWLSPSIVKSTKRKASIKAGEDCFTQSDHAEDLVYVGKSVNESPEAASVVTVSSDIEVVPVNSSTQGCPPLVAKETSSYDCIYSKCCGGPGGPTCCGGRPRPAVIVMAPSLSTGNLTSSTTTVGQIICSTVKSDASRPLVSPTADVNGAPAVELHLPQSSGFAVINQLTSIANSSLHQWLVSGSISSNSEQSPKGIVDEDLLDVSRPYDTSKWLMPPEASNWDNGKVGQKPTTLRQPPGYDYEAWLSTKLLTCASTT